MVHNTGMTVIQTIHTLDYTYTVQTCAHWVTFLSSRQQHQSTGHLFTMHVQKVQQITPQRYPPRDVLRKPNYTT